MEQVQFECNITIEMQHPCTYLPHQPILLMVHAFEQREVSCACVVICDNGEMVLL
jgi:hypothetical protein